MELVVLNKNFESVAVLDTLNSVIWTDRYSKAGDFEIYTKVTIELLLYLQQDYYLYFKDSEHVMLVEYIEINTDVENGTYLTVRGHSAEYILSRRIIWSQTILTGNLQLGIKRLLDENVISPIDPDRRISTIEFEMSDDPAITSLTIDSQYTYDNLYETISAICESRGIGFKMTLNAMDKLVFKLYSGVDRSYDQFDRPYVVFSPNFDNLISSNYVENLEKLRTVTLVAGEGEGPDRKTAIATDYSGGGSGMDRRELYTDARDLSQTADGDELTDEEYENQLVQRGLEKLYENMGTQYFEGQAETTKMYKYGVDFFMGDIVQIENEYGLEARSRVVELVRSQSLSGYDVYPTFSRV